MKPKTEKQCKMCPNMFRPYRSTDRYCSPACAKADMKPKVYVKPPTGKPKMVQEPSARKTAKARARKRDRNMCQLRPHLPDELRHDEHKWRLEVHHIVFLSQFGPDADWNLITLCERCHKQIAHKFKHDWQWKLLELVNGQDWLTTIRQVDDNWTDEKVPRWVQEIESIWRMKPESQDVATEAIPV